MSHITVLFTLSSINFSYFLFHETQLCEGCLFQRVQAFWKRWSSTLLDSDVVKKRRITDVTPELVWNRLLRLHIAVAASALLSLMNSSIGRSGLVSQRLAAAPLTAHWETAQWLLGPVGAWI